MSGDRKKDPRWLWLLGGLAVAVAAVVGVLGAALVFSFAAVEHADPADNSGCSDSAIEETGGSFASAVLSRCVESTSYFVSVEMRDCIPEINIYNSSGAEGLATKVVEDLSSEGYGNITARTATSYIPSTVVYKRDEVKPLAEELAERLGIERVVLTDVRGWDYPGDVAATLGEDWVGFQWDEYAQFAPDNNNM